MFPGIFLSLPPRLVSLENCSHPPNCAEMCGCERHLAAAPVVPLTTRHSSAHLAVLPQQILDFSETGGGLWLDSSSEPAYQGASPKSWRPVRNKESLRNVRS